MQQENGNTIKTQEEILKTSRISIQNLYAPLNSEKEINDQDILNHLLHPVLNDIESSILEVEKAVYEIAKVLPNMKKIRVLLRRFHS